MAATGLMLELSLVHYLPSSVFGPLTVRGLLDCALLCLNNNTCVSMIYNKVTADCYLHGTHATTRGAASNTINMAMSMYNTNRDPCIVFQDYELNKNLNVCYKFHSSPSNYSTARATCIRERAVGLLKVDTPEKNDFFVGIYGNGPRIERPFVDGQLKGGKWVFDNGDLMNPAVWQPTNPSGDGGCAQVYTKGLNDNNCSKLRAFICEIERLW